MKRVIWYSRHDPTAEQLAEIGDAEIISMKSSASISIETEEQAEEAVAEIRNTAKNCGARMVYGVFPTPILEESMNVIDRAIERGDYNNGCLDLLSAWNITRTPEGGKPTFHHKCFKVVGIL